MNAKRRISQNELEKLIELRIKYRSDCDVAFGTNEKGEIWAWQRWGNHPLPERVSIENPPDILKAIAGMFVEDTRDIKQVPGGRFFVDDDCAYWKDGVEARHEIVKLLFEEPERARAYLESTRKEVTPPWVGQQPQSVDWKTLNELRKPQLKQPGHKDDKS